MQEWVSDIGSMEDVDLKGLIGELAGEEQEISYNRRILHGKIDLLRAELVNRLRARHDAGEQAITSADVEKLTELITASEGDADAAQSIAEVTIEASSEDEPFPDLSSLDDAELKEVIARLTEEENKISYQRRILHGKIDILRAELVNRMRTQRVDGRATITGEDIDQLTEILSGKAAAAAAEGE